MEKEHFISFFAYVRFDRVLLVRLLPQIPAEALETALSWHEGPVVIDCQIDCDDKVWPMVAPGAPISEAFDENDLEADKQ